MITGEQIKAARAMLRLTQRQFAEMVHVTPGLVRRLEGIRGPIVTTPAILAVIKEALTAAGLELIDSGHYGGIGGPGIRLTGEVAQGGRMIETEPEILAGRPEELVAERDFDQKQATQVGVLALKA